MLQILRGMFSLQDIHVFIQLSWRGILYHRERISTLNLRSCRECFFQKLTQLSQWNNGLNPLPSNTDVFFQEITVFLQLSSIGLFETKRAYHHLEQPTWPEVFLSNLTQFSLWIHVVDTAASTIGVSLWRDTWFLHLSRKGLFGGNRDSLYLETPKWWKEVFHQLTQFSHGINGLDPPPSNRNGFLSSDTCVSSTQLNRTIWNKKSLSPHWKTHVAGSSPFKN
jgi:hypothetical protein